MANPITLKGEQWKQLVLLNLSQLHGFINNLPGNVEGGASGLTEDHIKLIEAHLGEAATYLKAWKVAVLPPPPVTVETGTEALKPAQAQPNGADPAPPKRKGGWQKGRKRNAPNPVQTAQ